jgi:succinate-semialdehyde dehydrogenase/glutarate-semialdehyde dehydrogenase
MSELLFIDGEWCTGENGEQPVLDPATNEQIGTFPVASERQIDAALAAAERGFAIWRNKSALERSNILRAAAAIIRQESEEIGRCLTREQGKPLAQATGEAMVAAELLEWCAEEGRRLTGKVIPSRQTDVRHLIVPEPVGPVFAVAAWNFPVFICARKLGDALAAGCSVVLKAAEEAPTAPAMIVRALEKAGLPKGVVSLLYGNPPEISERCIASPVIRKITFTGSTAVGRKIMMQAAASLKRATMELGGHAPVLIFDDVDPDKVAATCVPVKFRNAGQVCSSPTRYYVQDKSYDAFVESFTRRTEALKVGHGLEPGTEVGPLINGQRVEAMERLVEDALSRGARVLCGGERVGNAGNFYAPTVLVDVPSDAAIMKEEPFGPVVPIARFSTMEEAIRLANDNVYGLCGYLFTDSAHVEHEVSSRMETGVVAVNHLIAANPETPFGGVKDSGMGAEGGQAGIRSFLHEKYITTGPAPCG